MASRTSSAIRILLVDDHAVVRAGLRMIIQSRAGMMIVGEAGNRDDALALAASEHPGIILLDLDLGGDSGMALIADLIAAAGEARIIILTGLRDPEAHRQAVLLGAMGIVKKEKAAEVLISAIERVHAGEAWLDPSLMAGVLTEMTRSAKGRKTDPEADKIAALTNREREVIALVGEGIKSKEIAGRLFISETTVRHHLTSIFDKLGVADRVELLIYAYRHGARQSASNRP
jgi:two-component system, NarL family, nitrate/nitrite response regulator NarL